MNSQKSFCVRGDDRMQNDLMVYHDLGKIGVSRVLCKESRLTEEEWHK